ncbi:DNA-methyltransferase [Blastococcus atacamensis]|uniref:DNA-methyltransferase n=1 Tax=Blastococcus atacamensis TaxID=2070508 RepID=UPI000CECCF64|nr:site-specific DNA-methyltransferase [Blastococcus atacamensis]
MSSLASLGPDLEVRGAADFAELLRQLLGIDAELSPPVAVAVEKLIGAVGSVRDRPSHEVFAGFYGRMNQKLVANRDVLGRIYARAAKAQVTFNYPTKKALAWAVDSSDLGAFRDVLSGVSMTEGLHQALVNLFEPATFDETRSLIQAEAFKPSKLRKAMARQVAVDVLDSSAGPLAWSLWAPQQLHQIFGPASRGETWTGDYLEDLRQQLPVLFDRRRSLVIRSVDAGVTGKTYEDVRASLTAWLAHEYELLNNYGFAAVVIKCGGAQATRAWELSADLTLFGERFLERPIPNMFFRWREVMRETLEHVPGVDPSKARFDQANEGFTYRDLFVMRDAEGIVQRLVLLFQKNARDETPIPCPTCRGTDIEGNSYPSLGVRSWECANLLCPDRSIYNRGKRYSFKSLLTQAAIEHPENSISVESVRRWQRDVLSFDGDVEVIETLIQHYAMVGDGVVGIDTDIAGVDNFGRRLREEQAAVDGSFADFWQGAFFERFIVEGLSDRVEEEAFPDFEQWTVCEGESGSVLASFPENVIDRAVTSPPYFNAREYSQWPNLYCYLYDMHRIASQVFRVLKPGGIYAFNIFDYFDNERTIVFSAMGQKRLPLSALMVEVFRRVGFEYAGNMVWDKGDIQGKRGFNAGNFSPFYQSPFNCWEHVLLLRKPSPDQESVKALAIDPDPANTVARIQPVFKMVRGVNQLGHTAPFPQELPAALLGGLAPGAVVLDPFGGSGTTARAALDRDLRCILIEQDPEYCELAAKLTDTYEQERRLSGKRLS